jgi:hypothetical protein
MAVNKLSSWPERQSDLAAKRPATIEARRIFQDVADAARERTQDAIDTLSAIMKDPKTPTAARTGRWQRRRLAYIEALRRPTFTIARRGGDGA